MKRIIALVFMIVLASPIILAGVFINEVELNPLGADSGHEWVEIYNDGPSVNLSGWYLTDRDGNHFNFSDVEASGFYVLDSLTGLVDSHENVSLYDNFNVLQNQALLLSDSSNNGKSWQRVPDGTGNFVFEENTKAFTNLPTLIQNEDIDKTCVVESEPVTLMAQVTGYCIQDVLFEVDGLGNFSGNKIGDDYSYTVPAFNLSYGNVDWTVYTLDCFNRTKKGGIESFYVNEGTKLDISPSQPDGLNSWYVSEPLFSLEPGGRDIWYQWDSDVVIPYSLTGPFGLENIPSSLHGDHTIWVAGVLELNWFSDICSSDLGRNESVQTKMLKVDLTSPEIENLYPSPHSVVHTSSVDISAYIDEIYNSNSGINLSSVKLKIEGVTKDASVVPQDSLDARVNFTAALSNGNYSVSVEASDNAGRNSLVEWEFEVDVSPEFFIQINSPDADIYEKKKVFFDINIVDNESHLIDIDRIEYINHDDARSRWATLCVDCNGYERGRNLNEGENEITIKVTNNEVVKEANVSVFIDSKKPIVHSVLPKKNDIVNGSLFWLEYTEENLVKTILYINQTNENGTSQESHEMTCLSGKRQECSIDLDLSSYDGEEVEYWFTLEDDINTLITKRLKINIDTTNPVLIINMPQNATYDKKKVPFNLSASEEVDLSYLDSWDVNPKWKKICSSCNDFGFESFKTKNFNKGIHDITIKAEDEAGNSDQGQVGFLVDY